MKLKYTFETVDMGEETIMVPVGEDASHIHGVVKLNQSGKKIVDLLASGMGEKEVIALLSSEYENGDEELTKYVHKVIKILKANDLVE